MMRISLVDVDACTRNGNSAEYRFKEDCRQLDIPREYGNNPEPPIGFKDWGLVTLEGFEYYMASYEPPIVEESECG